MARQMLRIAEMITQNMVMVLQWRYSISRKQQYPYLLSAGVITQNMVMHLQWRCSISRKQQHTYLLSPLRTM